MQRREQRPHLTQNGQWRPADDSAGAGGSFRGLGPRGYVRSDRSIYEDVSDRLLDDPYVDASEVTVEVNEGVVRLSGTVADHHMQVLAGNIAEQCAGVVSVQNGITVPDATQG